MSNAIVFRAAVRPTARVSAAAGPSRASPALSRPSLQAHSRALGGWIGGVQRSRPTAKAAAITVDDQGDIIEEEDFATTSGGGGSFPLAEALYKQAVEAPEQFHNRNPGRFCEVTADMEDLMPDPDDEDLFDDEYDEEDDGVVEDHVHEYLRYRSEEWKLQHMAQKMRKESHNRYALTLEVARMAQARRPWQDFDPYTYSDWSEPPKPITRAIFDMEEEMDSYNARQRLKEIELHKEERDYQEKKEQEEIQEYSMDSVLPPADDEEENGAGAVGSGRFAEIIGMEVFDDDDDEDEGGISVDLTGGRRNVKDLLLGDDAEFDFSGLEMD